eukprot:133428_1
MTQKLVVWKGSSKNIDIDAYPNKLYKFGVFLNGKQISNTVSVRTSARGFNPPYYSPLPPTLKSIKQYYDRDAKYILITWDHPDVFGDSIVYKILLSNKSEHEVVELPYKISALFSIEIKICTISIINGKRYEGEPSKAIYVGL